MLLLLFNYSNSNKSTIDIKEKEVFLPAEGFLICYKRLVPYALFAMNCWQTYIKGGINMIDPNLLAAIGFGMIGVIVYMLLQSKVTPTPIFVATPLVAAAIAGFGFNNIAEYAQKGIMTTASVAILFIFSITFFGVLMDAGLFDPFVNFLVKKAGNNVVAVTVATSLIATVAHLDGSLAVTLLITVPALINVYKKLNIRPVILLLICGMAMSIMNLVPWGGPTARVAAVTHSDPNILWHTLIPLQVVGIIVNTLFAILLGVLEKRRGAGQNINADITAEEVKVDAKKEALKRPKLIWVNAFIAIATIALLILTKWQAYFIFMIGLAFALVINYPNVKDQSARIKAHAGDSISMAAILLSSGIFLGVLSGTNMIGAMAKVMISIIPAALGPYIHIILGVFAVPIGMLLGTDSYFFGLLPLAIGVGKEYGIDPVNLSKALLIGKNYGVLVTPHAATTYLAIGLAGIEIKELFKVAAPWLWFSGVLSLFIAVIMGIVVI